MPNIKEPRVYITNRRLPGLSLRLERQSLFSWGVGVGERKEGEEEQEFKFKLEWVEKKYGGASLRATATVIRTDRHPQAWLDTAGGELSFTGSAFDVSRNRPASRQWSIVYREGDSLDGSSEDEGVAVLCLLRNRATGEYLYIDEGDQGLGYGHSKDPKQGGGEEGGKTLQVKVGKLDPYSVIEGRNSSAWWVIYPAYSRGVSPKAVLRLMTAPLRPVADGARKAKEVVTGKSNAWTPGREMRELFARGDDLGA